MSFVTAATELVQGAAQNLAGIGSSLAEAATAVSGPTTGIAAAAEDEISVALASLFGDFGKQFQTLSAQAQAFHSQFVNLVDSSASAYASAEIANVQQTLLGGSNAPGATAAAGVDPLTRWEQVIATTTRNAETVFGASQAGLSTFATGVSTGFGQLASNPAAFFGNLQTAAQSVFLTGSPQNVASAVAERTLGGITATISDPVVLVDYAHLELYEGLISDFFPTGPEGALLTGVLNFTASPFSGLLLGAVGPFAAPGVAFLNTANAAFADITGGNVLSAVNGLLNTPANVVDAFFNGATLNLDPWAPLVNGFISGPTGGQEQVTGLSYGFPGLFSPGQVVDGASGPIYNGVGGSLLNALGVELTFAEQDFQGILPIPALPVGPIGATANLFSILGQAVGGTLLDSVLP